MILRILSGIKILIIVSLLTLSGCSNPYRGSINLEGNGDFEGKSFAVAPPQRTVAMRNDLEYNGKTFTAKWDWEKLRIQSDSVVREIYSLYYGKELAETPSDSLWNACLDWKNGGFSYVWSRRNDLNMAQLDTFELYLPAIRPAACRKIDKDLLIIPGVPVLHSLGFASNERGQNLSLKPFLMTGNAVWDNRSAQWLRIAAAQSDENELHNNGVRNENEMMNKIRHSFNGIPEGRDWNQQYESFLFSHSNGIEFFSSAGIAKPVLKNFKDLGLESDMTFINAFFSLGARYHFSRWGVEALWSRQALAYGKSLSDDPDSDMNGSWALHTQQFLLGARYFYGLIPSREEGLLFFAIAAGAGYENIKEWHPVSEFTNKGSSAGKPGDMAVIYARPGIGYRNLFSVGLDMPVEYSVGKDGYKYQVAFQFALGIVF